MRDITVRLDKGFFSKSTARCLESLGVSYLLNVPRYGWLGGYRGAWETAAADGAGARELRTTSGELWGRRLLSVERRRRIGPDEGELGLAAWETTTSADVLTNIEDIGPVEAWRAYNAGAVRWSNSGSRSWASSRPGAPQWTISAATPSRRASPRSPTSSSTSCVRTASAVGGGSYSRAASGCACCAPRPGSPPTPADHNPGPGRPTIHKCRIRGQAAPVASTRRLSGSLLSRSRARSLQHRCDSREVLRCR